MGTLAPVAATGTSVPEGGQSRGEGTGGCVVPGGIAPREDHGREVPSLAGEGQDIDSFGGDTGQTPSTWGCDLGSSLRVAG